MATSIFVGLVVMLSLFSDFASSDMLPGGLNPVDNNRPDVLKAADTAMNEFNQKSKNDYIFKIIKIVSAETQVVEGIKYYLTVQIGKTQCRKDSTNNPKSCDLFKDANQAQVSICKFQVLEVEWLNQENILTYSCSAQ
ncbi:cystatin-like [Pelodytes ibericus]